MSVREIILAVILATAAGCVVAGITLAVGAWLALIVGGILGALIGLLFLAEVSS